MEYNFFATVARMKYIERWALMRNTYPETLSEHSLEVSMLAHALCVIGNVRYGKHLDADKAAVIGLYHDASEIITGDMPTPIKYYNNRMKDLFHSIEDEACEKLIGQLPEDLQTYYRDYFFKQGDDTEETKYLWKLVKAADKLSALIKCMEEEKTEASPIDASSLEDCAYALPDPTGEEAEAEQARFHTYLMDNFKESVTSDTVTLHYTVANPADYDLDVPPATFGDAEISEDAIASDKKETEDEIAELQSFDYDLLTGSQKYTYDVIKDYLDLNLESYDYTYLYEPFAYTSGLQTNMPINMSEYKFYNEGDVQDYLALLGQLSDYYGKYLDFEQTKIDKGLFMNEHSASEVVRQCEEFIATPEENLLIATFEDKVRGVEGLSQEQIQDYITQNHDTVINSVIPCYKNVINFFNAHKDDGQNDLGLAGFEHGKEYYAYLLKDKVGTDKTPEEVIDWLDNAIDDVMYEYQATALANYSAYEQYFNDSSDSLYADNDPLETINYFKDAFADRFPAMPDVHYTIENVHESLEDIVSPAFYVTTPIDAYDENSIYLNMGSDGAGDLWSTLAHEGIPGHMYQFTYYLSTNPEPIRSLLNFNGYTEGWATYVEMMSYDMYKDYPDDSYADFERINSELNLLVSARVEIGVNYEGWDLAATQKYLSDNGFSSDGAESIMDYVIAEPVNYQMYVMGWQSFQELRDYAESALGNKFDEQAFHKVVLDAGPSQFYLIEKLVKQYVKDNL